MLCNRCRHDPCNCKDYILSKHCDSSVQPIPLPPNSCNKTIPCCTHTPFWSYCVILTLIVALIALALACCSVLLSFHIYVLSDAVYIADKLVVPDSPYFISDNRTVVQNVTLPAFNTSQSLQNVLAVKINNILFNDDWLYVSDVKNITTPMFNMTQLNDTLPNAIWPIEKLPNTDKELAADFNSLDTINLRRIVLELWAAVQEQQLQIQALQP